MTTPSFILKLLPPRWSLDALMRGLAEAVAGPLDVWRRLVERLHHYVDPNRVPTAWLDWLMEIVALPRDLDLAEANKRALIAEAIATWTTKGPAASIERYVQASTDITAQVVVATPNEFVVGVSLVGDVVGTAVAHYSFVIEVPAGSIAEADLRRLLIPVVPVFCRYTVSFV